MLKKNQLQKLYTGELKSMQEVADIMNCSVHKVSYWMEAHNIPRRSWSDATYIKRNPDGDPFKFRKPRNAKEAKLFGLGLGLYWGEGTKTNKHTIRLGNTDPELLLRFIDFLITFFQIDREDLKFGLQIFTDINPKQALNYWTKYLKVSKNQFQRPTVTISGSIGTYKRKSKYGVVTMHYNNVKATQILQKNLPA